jgi:hypothetical protein
MKVIVRGSNAELNAYVLKGSTLNVTAHFDL